MESILLVDDEATVSAELERTLERFGFEVETAHSVEAGLRSAKKTHFDAILVEFNVQSEHNSRPRAANGLQLVRQLRASGVSVPVLMFTAMERARYKTASLEAGADEFIQKTKGVPGLVSRLRAHLSRGCRTLPAAQFARCGAVSDCSKRGR
jgi:DNA-binding response OmpR family regulator